MLRTNKDLISFSPSQLDDIRMQNRLRASNWRSIVSHDNGYDDSDLRDRSEEFRDSAIPEAPPDKPSVLTLLDILPMFIKLTISRARMHKAAPFDGRPLILDWNMEPQWLELAGGK